MSGGLDPSIPLEIETLSRISGQAISPENPPANAHRKPPFPLRSPRETTVEEKRAEHTRQHHLIHSSTPSIRRPSQKPSIHRLPGIPRSEAHTNVREDPSFHLQPSQLPPGNRQLDGGHHTKPLRVPAGLPPSWDHDREHRETVVPLPDHRSWSTDENLREQDHH